MGCAKRLLLITIFDFFGCVFIKWDEFQLQGSISLEIEYLILVGQTTKKLCWIQGEYNHRTGQLF